MKKLFISAAAAALVAALAVPASALENQFGGYWRARAYTADNFNLVDSDADKPGPQNRNDFAQADIRTRLYYTAKFNDNFKFVNKFEFNTTFGDNDGGDIGADGDTFRVKNSYADFTLGSVNYKVGIHAGFVARGFLFDDDFSGATITYDGGDFSVPFLWVKAVENKEGDDDDVDYYAIAPEFKAGNFDLNPYVMFVSDQNTDSDLYYIGVDGDVDMDAMSAWFSFIYETGDIDDKDKNAFLAAVGGKADMGAFDLNGQILYASGDDDTDEEGTFTAPKGAFYGWSELMGDGIFDLDNVNGSPETKLTNLLAFNVGASMSPMEKLTVSADLWYAMLNEDNAANDDELGTEIDLKATYQLMDNLSLDVVAAYLFAGDVVTNGLDADGDDPYLLGTRLSLSF